MASTLRTQESAASAVAPAASLAIAALSAGSLPAGQYTVRCWGGYSDGTIGASEQVNGGNINFYVGATAIPLGIPPVVGALSGPTEFSVNLDGSTQISVGTGPNVGSTGVRYVCRITADMVRSPSGAPIP